MNRSRRLKSSGSIGFIILTWNSEKYIGSCIEAVQKIENYDIKVIVIDNGSTDSTLEQITKDRNTEIIRLDKNAGTTVSRNIGIKKASECDFICILDSDTIINQEAVDGLINVLQEDKANAIAGPKMADSRGVIQNSGRKIPSAAEKMLKVLPCKAAKKKAQELEKYSDIFDVECRPVGYLMSACWMIKREVIEKIGLLDEKIFYAPEDAEYCIRAWKSGYRVIYCGNVQIVHEWQRLSRKKIFSRHNYEHIKGLFYLYRKYHFCLSSKKLEERVK